MPDFDKMLSSAHLSRERSGCRRVIVRGGYEPIFRADGEWVGARAPGFPTADLNHSLYTQMAKMIMEGFWDPKSG